MPGGDKNIKPGDNTNGFQKNPQNINRNGQPPSIKRQLKELMKADGVLIIPKEEVISVNEDGSVSIEVSSQMMLAIKLERWAASGDGSYSLKAIQMIMEQIDGKPHQTQDINMGEPIQPVSLTDAQLDKVLSKIKPE